MIQVYDWKEREDGGADFTIEMDYDEMILFAKVGIMSTLMEKAKEVIKNEGFYRTISEMDRPVSDS